MAKFKFKTKKGKGKIRLFSCSDALESGKKLSGSRIEIFSNRELCLDGCRSICEYNDIFVKIKTAEGYITICGKGLYIPIFDGPQITVSGEITTIDFLVGQ